MCLCLKCLVLLTSVLNLILLESRFYRFTNIFLFVDVLECQFFSLFKEIFLTIETKFFGPLQNFGIFRISKWIIQMNGQKIINYKLFVAIDLQLNRNFTFLRNFIERKIKFEFSRIKSSFISYCFMHVYSITKNRFLHFSWDCLQICKEFFFSMFSNNVLNTIWSIWIPYNCKLSLFRSHLSCMTLNGKINNIHFSSALFSFLIPIWINLWTLTIHRFLFFFFHNLLSTFISQVFTDQHPYNLHTAIFS